MEIIYNNVFLLGFLAPGACAASVIQMQKGNATVAKIAAVFAFIGGICLSIGHGLLSRPQWYVGLVILLYAALVLGALLLGKHLRPKDDKADHQ